MAPVTDPYARPRPAALPGRPKLAERRSLLHRRPAAAVKQDALAPVLDELAAAGWRALHHVSLGYGPIDHVLVGPGGVAVIETRRRWGPVNVGRLDEQLLDRIYLQAKLVTVTCGRAATPLVVFPWAHLRPDGVTRRRDVEVLPLTRLAEHLEGRERRFSAGEVAELYRRLRRAADPAD